MLQLLNIEPKDYSHIARDILASFAHVYEDELSRKKLLTIIPKYHILITRLANKIDREVIDAGVNLRYIVSATTGLDHIDVNYANKKGIQVLSLKGERSFLENITATAEHTWGLLLSLYRRTCSAHQDVLQGTWQRDRYRGNELKGKVLGILGYGRLGKMVASYGRSFKMHILIHDPYIVNTGCSDIKNVPVNELLSSSDILTIHVPLTPETENLINSDKLSLMKKSSVIINTSRGKIVDERALLASLEKQNIAGAALDVMAGEENFRSGRESWPASDPLVQYAGKHANLLLTPHIGGATWESMHQTEIFMAEKLKSAACGD
ncbi:MAG: hypothetical protein HY885_06620 [Deltaproteobacteria bacterium]|nr:hypothetical protein [Deltaproteobacteria bacterium]